MIDNLVKTRRRARGMSILSLSYRYRFPTPIIFSGPAVRHLTIDNASQETVSFAGSNACPHRVYFLPSFPGIAPLPLGTPHHRVENERYPLNPVNFVLLQPCRLGPPARAPRLTRHNTSSSSRVPTTVPQSHSCSFHHTTNNNNTQV